MRNHKGKSPARHRYEWVIEPLNEHPSFVRRAMFGCVACYLHGRLMLVLAATNEEPWHGVMVCTERENQPAVLKLFPHLTPHSILPKWLYLPEAHPMFEETVLAVLELVLENDARLGSIPVPKAKKKRKTPQPEFSETSPLMQR